MRADDLKELTLTNIAGGAAPELFARELADVMRNIDDVNTEPKGARTITIQVRFYPGADRQTIGAEVAVSSKLAAVTSAAGTVLMGRKNGKLAAFVGDFTQPGLFDDGVQPLHAAGKAKA